MSNVSFRIKQDRAELLQQKVTLISVAVATANFLFGMCNYTVDSDVGVGDFSLVLGICTCLDTRTCDRACLRA